MAEAIDKALQAADRSHADGYESRATAYAEKLHQLDQDLTKTVAEAERNTIIFADRFPFLYLVRDYGLNYYAAYPGCSAEELLLHSCQNVSKEEFDRGESYLSLMNQNIVNLRKALN